MKKLIIPAILAATVLVAGMFAFMPVQKATTVHTTLTTSISASDNKLRIVDTIVVPPIASVAAGASTAFNLVIQQPNDRFTILDLHQQVAVDGGFVVIQTTGVTAANLQVVAISAAGAILGTSTFADLTVATYGAVAPNTQTLHAHIPSAANTVLIALASTTADVTLPGGTIITTTIEVLV